VGVKNSGKHGDISMLAAISGSEAKAGVTSSDNRNRGAKRFNKDQNNEQEMVAANA